MKNKDIEKITKNQKENFEMAIDTPVTPIIFQSRPVELEGKAKVSSKGQIVIPIEIRKAAGIEDGKQLRMVYRNGQIILEVEEYLSADELLGFFDTDEDKGDFVLDLNKAREDRSEEILSKGL